MDIFEKCYQRYIQDEVREQGVYPYFRALESPVRGPGRAAGLYKFTTLLRRTAAVCLTSKTQA